MLKKLTMFVALMAQPSYVHTVRTPEQKEVVDNWKGVKVVMYSAEWCHWCHSEMPILDELSVKYRYKAEFFNVDVDFLHIKTNGVPVTTISGGKKKPIIIEGYVEKDVMEQAINEYLLMSIY